MTGFRSNYSLERTQAGVDDSHVGLGAAYQEVNRSLRGIHCLTDLGSGHLTDFIAAVTGIGSSAYFHQSF